MLWEQHEPRLYERHGALALAEVARGGGDGDEARGGEANKPWAKLRMIMLSLESFRSFAEALSDGKMAKGQMKAILLCFTNVMSPPFQFG